MIPHQRWDLIIFDWDGTLVDSIGLIVSSLQRAAVEVGLPVPDTPAAREIIGLGLLDATERLFPGITSATRADLAQHYRAHYLAGEDAARPFDGMPALLSSLSTPERFLAVATGKSRAGLARAFVHSGLGGHFHYSRCADEGMPKPHPDMLLRLLDWTVVEPTRALMIGDTTHDLELAANAGVAALGVSWGAHAEHALATRPHLAVVDSVAALANWFRQNG